ncbi:MULTISPECIES: sugar kinase [unclassified Pseudomonas]|uniref:sugar kinase n=1 Tax=unclassified Pseudomonas TaxID=196821 RepID=UPI0010559CB6|nr:PfkB family carbohydrate kinase [Pseudomonas sp. MS-1(2024)]MEC4168030.1 sugar kinase [Pseudomonas sp. MS-1(2024)]
MSDSTETIDIVTCGEAMGLFSAMTDGSLHEAEQYVRAAAGAELNVATGLARLGFRVGYISRLGDDTLGHWLREVMARDGIDHRHTVQDSEHATGLMFKSRRSDGGDPDIEYYRKGSAASHLSLADYPAGYCRGARHLHITGISPALGDSVCELIVHMARDMRAAGCSVSFDPNLRPRLWASQAHMVACLNDLAGLADWVFPGLAEGRLLSGLEQPADIARYFLDRGCSLVVIKLGAEGAYYASATKSGYSPGYPVSNVVDTVGAGDGFAVGVISALLEGSSVAVAVARGNLIGARVLGFPGDSDGLPTHAELARFAEHT